MKRLDQWNSVIFLVISVIICVASLRLQYGNVHNPGPGFLPLWLGILLGILSVVLLINATLQKQGILLKEVLNEKIRWKKVLFVLICLIAYGALMGYLGFLVSTFLFLFILLRFIDRVRWWPVILWSLVGSCGSYFIFEIWMKLRLPKGILGI